MEKRIITVMLFKRQIILGFLLILFLLSIYELRIFVQSSSNLDINIFRIGYLEMDTITGLKDKRLVEEKLEQMGIKVKWIKYQDEVDVYKALERGEIDFGKVGDTVPLFFNKGKNAPIYLAAEPPSPTSRAIAISKDAKINSVQDLIGKKVAYTKFSNDQFFLQQLLVKNGLSTKDLKEMESIDSTLEEGKEMLEKGEVDALVTAEPYISQLETLQYSFIYDDSLQANIEVYLTTLQNIKERKEVLDIVLFIIYEYEEFLTNNIHTAAEEFYKKTKITHAEWMRALNNKTCGVTQFYPGMIEELQLKADFLYKNKIIKKKLNVNDFVINSND